MIKITDIAWVAGIIEGEGCIEIPSMGAPRIAVAMTDLDILIRLAEILGADVVRRKKNVPGLKPQWAVRIGGARSVGWMMTLYSFMGERRKGQIEAALADWKSRPFRHKGAGRVQAVDAATTQRILSLRANGLSQRAIGEIVGKAQPTISRVLLGTGNRFVMDRHSPEFQPTVAWQALPRMN